VGPFRIIYYFIALSLFFLFTDARAQHYYLKKYGIKEGMAGNETRHIFQDSRNYLWINTEGGLSRFDGKSFRNYSMNDGMPGMYCFVAFEDSLHHLWISYFNTVRVFDGTHFKEFPIENRPENLYIVQIWKGQNNKMRFLTSIGIWELQDSVWRKLDVLKNKDGSGFTKVLELTNGALLFCLTDSIVLWKSEKDFKTIARTDEENLRFYNLTRSNGRIYVSTWKHLYLLDNDKLTLLHDDVLKNKRIRIAFNDSKGRLFVGTEGNGFFVFDANGMSRFDPSSNYIYGAADFIEDHEHNIWVATLTTGLVEIKKSHVTFYDSISSLKLNWLAASCRNNDGKMYFSQGANSLVEWNGHELVSLPNISNKGVSQRATAWFKRIIADNRNRLWLFNNQYQLFRFSDYKIEDVTEKFGIDDESFLSFNPRDNCVYIATANKTICIKPDDTFTIDTSAIHSSDFLNSIGLDSSSNIWTGTTNGKVFMKDKDGNHEMNALMGLPIVQVNKFSFSNANTLWIGTTGEGMYRFKLEGETWKQNLHVTRHQGLPSDIVYDIITDQKNRVWVATHAGLVYLSFSVADTGVTFTTTHLAAEQGFTVPDFLYPKLVSDNSGNIWYSPNHYLACIHAGQLEADTISPGIQLENVMLFSDTSQWKNFTNLFTGFFHLPLNPVLPYDQNNISFHFNGISFTGINNMEYNYRLHGYESNWNSSSTNTTITYPNLKPGKYHFEVRAKKPSSNWSNKSAAFAFIITPPWYNTWWFITLLVITAAGFIYVIYRFRLNQVLRLHAIRNRIAHDLHDDIGSTLNSISIFSRVAQQEPEKQVDALEMIGESSRKVIEAMSDIVWTINPKHDTMEEIILRMRSFSYNLLRAKNIEHTFRADENINDLKFTLENRRNFYLFFKEVINNLVKHSNASRAEILLTYSNHYVVLIIRDNGNGFDINKEYNGNGLNSMRARAEELKAIFTIESSIDNGTSVQLKIKS